MILVLLLFLIRLGCHGRTENFINYPTFKGSFFYVFMGKTNVKLDFLYIVGSTLKC